MACAAMVHRPTYNAGSCYDRPAKCEASAGGAMPIIYIFRSINLSMFSTALVPGIVILTAIHGATLTFVFFPAYEDLKNITVYTILSGCMLTATRISLAPLKHTLKCGSRFIVLLRKTSNS